jgi:Lhr-like helicase
MPPDVLLTTPESVEVMLVSRRSEPKRLFAHVQAVIVDELHAFAGDDRGWHLLAVLARVERLAGRELQRVGLSATIGNPGELLGWLVEPSRTDAVVIDAGGARASRVAIAVDHAGSLTGASHAIASRHGEEKRLVFVDSRSRVEQLAAAVRAAGVDTFVSHSSLAADERRRAEAAFAEARDGVIVATSTLELGIDVGDLDRVIQVDAPGTVASFLQRIGRTGRRAGTQRNCLFLATSDDARLRAAAVVQLWSEGFVEPVLPPPAPFHILAQHSVFTSPPLFTVFHGRDDLGRVHETSFHATRGAEPVLLLGGRSWRVTHVDWSRRVAYVEPSTERGRSRWVGGGGALSSAMASAIRRVLAGADPIGAWSERAGAALERIRHDFAWVEDATTAIVRDATGDTRWWTFAGLRANLALAAGVMPLIRADARPDNVSIPVVAGVSRREFYAALGGVDVASLAAEAPVAADAIDGLKFSICLPTELALRTLRQRYADPSALKRAATEPVRWITTAA